MANIITLTWTLPADLKGADKVRLDKQRNNGSWQLVDIVDSANTELVYTEDRTGQFKYRGRTQLGLEVSDWSDDSNVIEVFASDIPAPAGITDYRPRNVEVSVDSDADRYIVEYDAPADNDKTLSGYEYWINNGSKTSVNTDTLSFNLGAGSRRPSKASATFIKVSVRAVYTDGFKSDPIIVSNQFVADIERTATEARQTDNDIYLRGYSFAAQLANFSTGSVSQSLFEVSAENDFEVVAGRTNRVFYPIKTTNSIAFSNARVSISNELAPVLLPDGESVFRYRYDSTTPSNTSPFKEKAFNNSNHTAIPDVAASVLSKSGLTRISLSVGADGYLPTWYEVQADQQTISLFPSSWLVSNNATGMIDIYLPSGAHTIRSRGVGYKRSRDTRIPTDFVYSGWSDNVSVGVPDHTRNPLITECFIGYIPNTTRRGFVIKVPSESGNSLPIRAIDGTALTGITQVATKVGDYFLYAVQEVRDWITLNLPQYEFSIGGAWVKSGLPEYGLRNPPVSFTPTVLDADKKIIRVSWVNSPFVIASAADDRVGYSSTISKSSRSVTANNFTTTQNDYIDLAWTGSDLDLTSITLASFSEYDHLLQGNAGLSNPLAPLMKITAEGKTIPFTAT